MKGFIQTVSVLKDNLEKKLGTDLFKALFIWKEWDRNWYLHAKGKPSKGAGQYSKIYWYHVSFSPFFRRLLIDGKRDIEGFNITPYRISYSDVMKAKARYTHAAVVRYRKEGKENKYVEEMGNGFRGGEPFDRIIDFDPTYVDFDDGDSANFHKWPDGKIQFVLTCGGIAGPGWVCPLDKIDKDTKPADRINKIKWDYYFPNDFPFVPLNKMFPDECGLMAGLGLSDECPKFNGLFNGGSPGNNLGDERRIYDDSAELSEEDLIDLIKELLKRVMGKNMYDAIIGTKLD